MTSPASRVLLRSLKTRLYSTQAAYKTKEAVKQNAKVTRLDNGVIVASIENDSPVTRIAVAVNAGSRFEDGDNLGITHCLRSAAGLSNQVDSGFGLTRKIQQAGGSLECTGTKEHLIYSTECVRSGINACFGHLMNIVSKYEFKPWQLKDMQPAMKYDLTILNSQPHVRLFEMIHKAAFRDTLGNSLYVPEYNIGTFDREQVLYYVNSHFTSDRVSVVGVGIDHDDLVSEAKKFQFDANGSVNAKVAKYVGGELRQNGGGELTFASLAVEAPNSGSKDAIAAGVLQHVMGTGSSVKYGSNSASKLGKAVSTLSVGTPAISCFNASYSDGGLFGFTAIMPFEDSEKILKAATAEMAAATKSGAISQGDVQRAKNQLKASVAMAMENGESLLDSMVGQVIANQDVSSYDKISADIDKVTTDDVVNVAKKMFNSRPSMAAVGNLAHTPYLDGLLK